jgi:hypothetical protein
MVLVFSKVTNTYWKRGNMAIINLGPNQKMTIPGNSRIVIGNLPQPNSPNLLLGKITDYLKNNMASFRNPSFYNYRLDGDEYCISDGGGDMYDTGNYTIPWLLDNTDYSQYNNNPNIATISYSVIEPTLFDTNFYYSSLGYIQFDNSSQDDACLPLTVLGPRTGIGNPVGWQVCGNSGADGGGSLSTGILYTGETLSGFTVHAFYRETYDAGDPSHCNLYMLLGHSNWSSVFGSINSYADPVVNGGCGGYFYTSGPNVRNILAIQTLLSKPDGNEVTSAECQTVVQNFAQKISESLA